MHGYSNESQPRSYRDPATRAPKSNGHDVVLNAILKQERTIHVTLLSGETRSGRLVGKDKFTVTVRGDDGLRRVIYKHAIEEFYADESPAQQQDN